MRAVPDVQSGESIYLRRAARGPIADFRIWPEAHYARFGGLERSIPLQAWRGRKVQLSVRLKNEGNALAFVMAQINRLDGAALYTGFKGNAPRDNSWRTHRIVLQVPDNASYLFVYAGFTGAGEFWLEGLTLEAAAPDAVLTETSHLAAPPPMRSYEDYLPIMLPAQSGPEPATTTAAARAAAGVFRRVISRN
jgi:hypothetical protein